MARLISADKQRPQDAAPAQEATLCRQLDNLQRISAQQKRDQLGDDWFKQVRDLYNVFTKDSDAPMFRPTVRVPEAQTLGFMEAIDLSDIEPRIYLIKSWENYQQDENAEVCLQAFWRDAHVNMQILYANMWSWFCGNGFVQVGHDPTKRNGRGDIVVRWRDPESVFPDPYAIDDEDWQYLILEDFMWLDRVRQLWPIPGQRVTLTKSADTLVDVSQAQRSNTSFGLEVPRGPMQAMIPGMPVSSVPGDARVRVRTLFLRDSTRKKVGGKDDRMTLSGMAPPEYAMRYPRGRMIVECNGVILFDGENPYLHREFPVIRFIGMPALHGFWAPPPLRYTKSLQEIAERFITQDFENTIRLNNGTWFIDEATGIDAERFGGVPGEVQMKAKDSPTPELVQPKGSSEGMNKAGELLKKQRELQGFAESRMGKTPQGNTSTNLFEGAVSQGQTLTRGRARLTYAPIVRMARLILMTMAQYTKDERVFADPRSDGYGIVRWKPVDEANVEKYIAHVDPASIRPFSDAMLASRVPLMRNMGLLDRESALEALRWPNRKKVVERLGKEAQAAAQAEVQKKAAGKGGKK